MNNYKNWRRECRRLVRNLRAHFLNYSKQDAEDALEAAIELSLTKGLIFDNFEEESAWLFVAAWHYLLNYRRKRSRLTLLDDAKGLSIEDEMVNSYENRDMIEAAMNILNKEDRELLLKRFEDGKSISEIAMERGVNTSKLESRSKRAIKKIRKYIDVS